MKYIIEIEPDILFKIDESEFDKVTFTATNNHFMVEFVHPVDKLTVNNIVDGYGINRLIDFADKRVTAYKEI